MPDTLVIIVTYQAESWLPVCMESVRALGDRVDVAVVDNASTDGTRTLLSGTYRSVITHLHPLQDNLGFGRAHNFVFAQPYAANYTHFLLLNQDAALSADAFAGLRRWSDRHPEFGVLSPVHYYSAEQIDLRFASYLTQTTPVADGLAEAEFVNAAIWLIRREVIDAIGGFNPVFPHYGEDYNFLERAKLAGFRVGIATALRGYHYRRQDPIPDRYDRLPYHQWLTGLNRLVHPGIPVWRALAGIAQDYLPLLLHLVSRGRWERVREHGGYLLRLLGSLPTVGRYRRLRIAVSPTAPSRQE